MDPRNAAALWGFETDLNVLLDDYAVQVCPPRELVLQSMVFLCERM
jgi:hypothetical protein